MPALEPLEPAEPAEPSEPWVPVCGHGVPVRGAAGVVFGAEAFGEGFDEVAADSELADDREVAAAE